MVINFTGVQILICSLSRQLNCVIIAFNNALLVHDAKVVIIWRNKMCKMYVGAWRYRHFIASFIKTEFRARFARSKLGGLWMLINPLAQVTIFAFILSTVMSSKLPGIENKHAYALYLLAGMAGWSLFVEVITRSLTLFIDHGSIIKKIAFPKVALPLIVVGSALISNTILLVVTLLIFICMGFVPGVTMLWVPVLMLINVALALGVGLCLGVLNVFVRDIGHIVPVILQFAFWATPVVYTLSIIPLKYQHLVVINPLSSLIISYQNVILFNKAPLLACAYICVPVAILFLSLAFIIFRRASSEMVDLL